jgi:hypothetical protein
MMKTSIHLEGTGGIKEFSSAKIRTQCPAFPQISAEDLNSVEYPYPYLALINLQATHQNAFTALSLQPRSADGCIASIIVSGYMSLDQLRGLNKFVNKEKMAATLLHLVWSTR